MNELNRASHDEEIERLQTIMKGMDPTSEEYSKVVRQYDILVQNATEDDKVTLQSDIEKMKMEAEEEESKFRRFWRKVEIIILGATPVVTLITTVSSYAMLCRTNERIQKRSIAFEERGMAHTDRSDKFISKPSYPKL